jgi:hypothetical protein
MKQNNRFLLTIVAAATLAATLSFPVEARQVRHSAARHVNVNHNVNVHRSRHVDVDVNRGYRRGCCYYGGYRPVAAAAAVTATALVVGSIVNTLPPSCSMVEINGLTYQQCGNTWYQPQISGSSTTYVVVNPPG